LLLHRCKGEYAESSEYQLLIRVVKEHRGYVANLIETVDGCGSLFKLPRTIGKSVITSTMNDKSELAGFKFL